MAIDRKDNTETTREEVYRDYEERDLNEGWPYPDADGGNLKRNGAYGQSAQGFDPEGNPGLEVAGETAIRSEGGPALAGAVTHDAINDDALEEAVNDALLAADDIDEDQITVTVRNGVVELTGSVETRQQSLGSERRAEAVAGVRSVRNHLVLIGVDSHIPMDADE